MKLLLRFSLPLLLISFFIGCSPSIRNTPGVSLELAEFRKAQISDLHYSLSLDIPANEKQPITGDITIEFDLKENLIDLPLDFKEDSDHVLSVMINGNSSDIIFENEHILLPQSLIKTGVNNISLEFIAGDNSLNRKPEFLYTLFVPDRARTAFPLFDQPNLKAVYDLSLTTPSNWEAISNAPLENKTVVDSTTTWDFEDSDLISSYLFSFVAGQFDRVTQTVDGREMTMLHRETDEEKVNRNLDDIFALHASSITWLENYTGIDYPFKKFDFALIPSFQYGGMEHVGAIQYRASSLFLDKDPSDSRLLSRASLIAHETAHMWFGDLVTMDWFNDVWTKEVFANFMAAKIVNPSFPDINHELNFLVRHYPSAYAVDRTEGANAIRQYLPNLNEAGTMYGNIIYNKAPIMMRQLEMLVGEEAFQQGMQEYLSTFSFTNATWPDLVSILDNYSKADLKKWSEVWVSTPGRPHFEITDNQSSNLEVLQNDPSGDNRVWPQTFQLTAINESEMRSHDIFSNAASTNIELDETSSSTLSNSDGYGYGLFPISSLDDFGQLNEVQKASEFINIHENMLEGNVSPLEFLELLIPMIESEENQLLLNLELGNVNKIYWDLLNDEGRHGVASRLETLFWELMLKQEEPSRKKIFFNTYRGIALSRDALEKLYKVWNKDLEIENLSLSENDFIGLASTLAIKLSDKSAEITAQQLTRIENPDTKRRFEFLIPSLSNDQNVRDQFFESLKEEQNRETESWVLAALGNLHHPLRLQESEKYILPSLELLQEIQQTGDIFFPAGWTSRTLGNYSSDSAVQVVRTFLKERPNYNYQLKLKILQAADPLFRANAIKKKWN